ncbi:MAG: PRC-barrel domain containing protein [Sandaracinaceae bacterium]|nr:PRC-barrel domain containing protein [Sandaracinaceae bacterium]
MRLSDEDLHGRTVISADGLVLGEIVALLLESEAWRVDSLQVRLRKDAADRIGAERSMFRPGVIEVESRLVQSVGDAVLLSVPLDQLRAARQPEAVREGEEHGEEPLPAT